MKSEHHERSENAGDVLASVADSLRQWAPPPEEERVALDRVWTAVRWKAKRLPAHLLHDVQLEPPMARRRVPLTWAAAAAAVFAALAISGADPTRWFASVRDAAATVETLDGTLYRLSGQAARAASIGDRVYVNERLQTNGGAGAQLVLKDGSRVEMRSQSELRLERAEDGVRVRLVRGGIIVNAAKQRDGHLYVQTRDMTVAVVGTVFLVKTEDEGSRVAVIEGEVRVREGTVEMRLRPGEQLSTSPSPAEDVRTVKDEIAWSRQAEAHLVLLQQAAAQSLPPPASESGAVPGQPVPVAPRGAQFEEASIRPCARVSSTAGQGRGGGGGGTFQMTPGRLYANCVTVAWLIGSAYPPGVPDKSSPQPSGALASVAGIGPEAEATVRQKVRGPEWVYTDRYTIEAVGDPSASTGMLTHVMLWDLLERRLQLKVHAEVEHIRAFDLTVARGGLKIKPIADGEVCVTDPSRSRLQVLGFSSDDPTRCEVTLKVGWVNGEGPNYRWEFAAGLLALINPLRSDMSESGFPTGLLTGPRIDNKTGIPARQVFNFVLEFGPDETTPGLLKDCAMNQDRSPRCADRPTAPPLMRALEEQLGLRLERTTTPREFVVIDRVERPSPN